MRNHIFTGENLLSSIYSVNENYVSSMCLLKVMVNGAHRAFRIYEGIVQGSLSEFHQKSHKQI
jgi:hypothetical protein